MLIFSKNASGQSAANHIHSLDPKELKLHYSFIFSPSNEKLLMLKHTLETKAELGIIVARSLDAAFRQDPTAQLKEIVASHLEQYTKDKENFDNRCINALSEFVEALKPNDTVENDASSRLAVALNAQRILAAERYQAIIDVLKDFTQYEGREQDGIQLIENLKNLNLKPKPENAQTINRPVLKAKM